MKVCISRIAIATIITSTTALAQNTGSFSTLSDAPESTLYGGLIVGKHATDTSANFGLEVDPIQGAAFSLALTKDASGLHTLNQQFVELNQGIWKWSTQYSYLVNENGSYKPHYDERPVLSLDARYNRLKLFSTQSNQSPSPYGPGASYFLTAMLSPTGLNLYPDGSIDGSASPTVTISPSGTITLSNSNGTLSLSPTTGIKFGTAQGTLGASSATIGVNLSAAGSYSLATGINSSAAGTGSFATGNFSSAAGSYSFAANQNTSAQSFAETVFGRYNVLQSSPTPNTVSWVATDNLFVVGNGANAFSRSNALTIRKDGATAIGQGAIATKASQIVLGKYNDKSDATTSLDGKDHASGVLIIGAGSGDQPTQRKNAMRVTDAGVILIQPAGDLLMGDGQGNNFTVGEKP